MSDLTLKLIGPRHVQKVHDLFCIPEVFEYLADGAEPPRSVAKEWAELSQADWEEYGGGLWAIEPVDGGDLIGLARLSGGETGELELTYLLHPGNWKQGLATRMAHTVISQCFDRGKIGMIWAGADEPNTASISVMRNLGMTFRRNVSYPAGRGVEYEISKDNFVPERFERLKVVQG